MNVLESNTKVNFLVLCGGGNCHIIFGPVKGSAKRCPSCNVKASLKDVRTIYARKLRALDTAERDRLQMEFEKVKSEKAHLESEFTKVKLNCEMQKKQIEALQRRIRYLETVKPDSSVSTLSSQHRLNQPSVYFINNVVVNEVGGCRVLACSADDLIVVSQKCQMPTYSQFGICKIRPVSEKYTIIDKQSLHTNVIRDMAFHPQERNQLLTVSLDRTAKVNCVHNDQTLITFQGDNMLWSCAWNTSNSYHLMTGSQNGIVTTYDVRNSRNPLHVCLTPGDTTPVISLASIPPTKHSVLENGGLICCRLNSVYAFHSVTEQNELILTDGPFISLSYNATSTLLLLSTRPGSRFPATRHMLNQLASSGSANFTNELHRFTCGKSAQMMSRSCQWMMPDGDVWVGAHNESENAVELLSVNKNGPIHTIPVHEPILDVRQFSVSNNLFLASLSEKSLLVNKIL